MHNLINVSTELPSIICDIRYATPHNFTKHQLYPFAACYVHKDILEPLRSLVKKLETYHMRLKIFDAYRPHAYQFLLWNHCPDERYVGNPHKGSSHNRGVSLDCTLTTLEGIELAMGTEFDSFSEKAHRTYTSLPSEVHNNRTLLESVFEEQGFIGLETEWWHFDYHCWNDYPLLTIGFEELLHE